MKKLLLVSGLMIFMVLQQSCGSSKKAIVSGKNDDLSANFRNIKTYSWTTGIDNIPKDAVFIGTNGVYVFNNASARKMIKDTVKYQLDAKGYKMDRNNPDVLVSLSVLEQPGELQTVNGYVTLSTGEKVRTKDNISYTEVKPGTLIVNLINAKTQSVIWQGFVSGILQADDLADQVKVRQAVSTVFSQFKLNNLM